MSHSLGPIEPNPLKEKNSVLNLLEKFVFHDLPVNSFTLRLEKTNSLVVQVTPYVEDTKEYEIFNLIFTGITEFETDGYSFNDKAMLEITDFDYTWEEQFIGEMLMLISWNQGVIKFNFKCDHVNLEYAGIENSS